jgi:hypothetical protein
MPTNNCSCHDTALTQRHICLHNKEILFMTSKISPKVQINNLLEVRNLIPEIKRDRIKYLFLFLSPCHTAVLISRHQKFQQQVQNWNWPCWTVKVKHVIKQTMGGWRLTLLFFQPLDRLNSQESRPLLLYSRLSGPPGRSGQRRKFRAPGEIISEWYCRKMRWLGSTRRAISNFRY